MEQHLVPSRPVSESIFKSANAIAAARDHEQVTAAVRDASLALEYHLDTLARELSNRDRGIEPAFRSRAETVEARLRDLLSACWDHQRLPASQAVDPKRLSALAHDMRKVASEEVDLVFDQLIGPPALD